MKQENEVRTKEHLRRGGNRDTKMAEAKTDRRMSWIGKRGAHGTCKRWGCILWLD
jgi:hypothetical protein